ncbi:MAG TPA: phospholipase D-like domain-containing protein [Longimicrobiaceae bacterium]
MSALTSHPWWLLLLAAVGCAAVLTAVVSLFFSLGRRPNRMSITQAPAVDTEAFLLGISGTVNAPLMGGGTVTLLNNGVEIFPAILRAIREAERSINFMAYIWEPGKVSDRLVEALCERARDGVEVRVLLDGMGGMRTPDEKIAQLQEAGGKVQWFRQFRFGKITRFHKRNHRRAIVMDGKVGFTGGAAVGDKWLGDAQDVEHWRDIMVEVRGCLAGNLQSAFVQLWASVAGEILMGPAFFPSDDGEEPAEGEEAARHVNVISSPADEAHPLRNFFWISFRCARERLWVTSPYFVPDDDTRQVIMHRARHGVDVRILLPDGTTDAKPIRQASHSYYQELLDAGVRIWEYQGVMIHSKALVVDGVWTVVGSANMDIRSKELNQENVIGILDRGFGAELERTFLADLERAAEIRPEEWRRRGLWPRVKERFWVLFAEQY